MYKVSGGCVAAVSVLTGIWQIPQLEGISRYFPVVLVIIIGVFIMCVIYLLHSEFQDYQNCEDSLKESNGQRDSVQHNNEKLSSEITDLKDKIDDLKSENKRLKLKNDRLSDQLDQQKGSALTIKPNIENINLFIGQSNDGSHEGTSKIAKTDTKIVKNKNEKHAD